MYFTNPHIISRMNATAPSESCYLSPDFIFTFTALFIIIYVIIFVVCYIWCMIATSQIFKKMDVATWKAFIPFYNDFVLAQAVTKENFPQHPWVIGVFAVVTDLVSLYGASKIFEYGNLTPHLAFILYTMVWVYILYHLSKKFGHGRGMTAVLYLFPHIGLPMLGFNKYEHLRDPKDVTK